MSLIVGPISKRPSLFNNEQTASWIMGLISVKKVAAGTETLGGLRDQSLDHLGALRTGQQGRVRLELPHVGGELLEFGSRDVRRIADDEIELPIGRHGREQVALDELDPIGHAVLLGVVARRRPARPG